MGELRRRLRAFVAARVPSQDAEDVAQETLLRIHKSDLSVPGAKSRVQRARRMLAAELERCCAVELGAEGRVEDFERKSCDC